MRRGGFGDLLGQVVFLGGSTTHLLLTDPAAPAIRATLDVDVVIEATTVRDYLQFEGQLERRGFRQDETPGAPRCRRIIDGVRIDVMPVEAGILGFTNRWYALACETAERVELEPDLTIRLVTAPLFLATKLEAFRGRGEGDFLASRDLEDVVSLVDGRVELADEIASAPAEVRAYLTAELHRLLEQPRFRSAVQAHLPPDAASQARAPIVLERIESIYRVATRD